MSVMTYEMANAIEEGKPLMLLTEIEHPSGLGRFWSGVGTLDYKSYPTIILIHFDGPGFIDEEGHTITGVNDAAIDTSDPKFGAGCLSLDGTDDCIVIGADPDFNIGSQDFSVDFEFKQTGGSGSLRRLFGQDNSGGTDRSISGYLGADGKIVGTYTANGTAATDLAGTTVIDDDEWHHYSFERKGNMLYLSLDGGVEATAMISGSIWNSSSSFAIGQIGDRTGSSWFGKIDEFRLVIGGAVHEGESFEKPKCPYPTSLLWTGAGRIMTITPISHTTDLGVQEIQFSLVGANSEEISKLSDDVRNKGGRVWLACTNDQGKIVSDPYQIVDSQLDYQSEKIDDDGTAVVQITARTGFFNLDRALNDVWSSEDQQFRYPGDTGLDLVSKLQNQSLVWGPT